MTSRMWGLFNISEKFTMNAGERSHKRSAKEAALVLLVFVVCPELSFCSRLHTTASSHNSRQHWTVPTPSQSQLWTALKVSKNGTLLDSQKKGAFNETRYGRLHHTLQTEEGYERAGKLKFRENRKQKPVKIPRSTVWYLTALFTAFLYLPFM